MYRFWDTIIEPILEVLQPETIMEISSEHSLSTQNLLEFCRRNNAKLHVIHLLAGWDVADWQEEYDEHVAFHSAFSLKAIPQVDRFDVVLIDGDHNWYTVFNELKLIERQCAWLSQPFPLILLHDIGWPYGRRDVYYDPETIPDVYRQPFKQMGMRPDSVELLEGEGLNQHLFNAVYENNSRNGVLTAIEDFLKETEQQLELVKIPGIHGLGILVPLRLKEQNEKLAKLLENLNFSPAGKQHVELVERVRLEAEIRREEHRVTLEAKEAEVEILREQRADKDRQLSDKIQQLAELQRQLSVVSQERSSRSVEVEMLDRWMEKLSHASSALLNSRRWKIGNAVGEILRRIMLQPRTPMAQDQLREVAEEFHAWRKSLENTKALPDAEEEMVLPSFPVPVPDARRAPIRSTRGSLADGDPSVDIVVCVHNALDDVKACLASVAENTPEGFTLYIVNDGSDEPTTEYLREFSSTHKSCVLLENSVAQGYTRAANKGLRASTADYVVLLNSDTIVPFGWLERLLECGESDSRIGIIGPLSNAASWQSVPEVSDGKGDWAVNPLPENYSVNDMAEVVDSSSERRFPRVPLVNGFCFVTKRTLIDAIGYLDEELFPKGYGEENDYCLRAQDAGFELVIADNAYIYHAKSKSYSHDERHILRRPSGVALKQKYGAERISGDVDIMRNEYTLQEIRRRVQTKLKTGLRRSDASQRSPLKVLFLLPVSGGGGGAHSIVQEVQDMWELGVLAQVAVPARHRDQHLRSYPSVKENVFHFFDFPQNLVRYARNFDVVVASVFTSVKLLRWIYEAAPEILPVYYIQDYEPWFVEPGSKLEEEAKSSYTAVPDMLCFAKTDWIRETVKRFHSVEVHKVSPSLDHSVYYPRFGARSQGAQGTIKVVAMVRPETPRRSPVETMKVLRSLKEEHGDTVSVTIFGCETNNPKFLALPQNFEFENRGVLIREEVAELLRATDIFLDLSKYQAFGRTGLEAMACGCATVLPVKGGTSEYARHRDNALLVDTENFEEMVGAARELIEDENLRQEMSKRGTLTATNYNTRKAAISELVLFQEVIQSRANTVLTDGGGSSGRP